MDKTLAINARARVALALAALGMGALLASPARAAGADAALSAYDCASVSDAASPTASLAVHVDGAARRIDVFETDGVLRCLRQTAPATRQLDRAEAGSLITALSATTRSVASPTATRSPAAALDVGRARPRPLPGVTAASGTGGTDGAGAASGPATAGAPARDLGYDPVADGQTAAAATKATAVTATATVGAIDHRVRVADTTAYPNDMVSYIAATFPSGSVFSCTATLVSPYVLLTAGHCVWDKAEGGYASRIRVSPGLNQTTFGGDLTFPFGNRLASSWVTTDQWKALATAESYAYSDYVFDVAAVFLPAPFTFASAFFPVRFDMTPGTVTDAGYPGTVQNQTGNSGQWTDTGSSVSTPGLTDRLINALIDSSPGNSGGPFWASASTGLYLNGSLSGGSSTTRQAVGPRYNSATNKSVISDWMATTPALAPETGWWWDAGTPGRGFAMETHPTNGHVFFAAYQYDASGLAGWVTATLTPSAATSGRFSGALQQTVSGVSSDIGTMVLDLTNQVAGTITWPASVGGGTTAITRYPFDAAQLFSPNYGYSAQPGWWWNPSTGGTGYMIEIQNNHLFLGYFGPRADGTPVWQVADNTMTSTTAFSGALQEYSGAGPRYASKATGALTPTAAGSVSITFTSNTTATLVMGGRTIAIQRFSSY